LALLLGFAFVGAAAGGFRWLDRRLPSPYRLRDIRPAEKTVVHDAHGQAIHEFFKENRDRVPLARMPKPLVAAILATEDRKFYEHWGVDVFGILRAWTKNCAREPPPGGSTITQQLARNLFLTHDRTYKRKVQELILALRIERILEGRDPRALPEPGLLRRRRLRGPGGGHTSSTARSRPSISPSAHSSRASPATRATSTPPLPRSGAATPSRRAECHARDRSDRRAPARASRGHTDRDRGDPGLIARRSLLPPEIVRQYLIERYGGCSSRGWACVSTTLDLELQRVAEAAEQRLTELERELQSAGDPGDLPRAAPAGRGRWREAGPARLPPGRASAWTRGPGTCSRWSAAGASPRARSTAPTRPSASRVGIQPFIYGGDRQRIPRLDIVLDTPVHFQGATPDEEWRPQNYSGDFPGL
jgi:hypothetical protein